jgi:hypothetical protein
MPARLNSSGNSSQSRGRTRLHGTTFSQEWPGLVSGRRPRPPRSTLCGRRMTAGGGRWAVSRPARPPFPMRQPLLTAMLAPERSDLSRTVVVVRPPPKNGRALGRPSEGRAATGITAGAGSSSAAGRVLALAVLGTRPVIPWRLTEFCKNRASYVDCR